MTPDAVAAEVLRGRHGLVSFAYPAQATLVAAVCQSFVFDNGAFTHWKRGRAVDYDRYYLWVDDWIRHPGFDWALIPDVIDGSEAANDALLGDWPFGVTFGVPVWHLHESITRLRRLTAHWPRVAFGSSGRYSTPGSGAWWERMGEAMRAICDPSGVPPCKLHGLRMLNPAIFTRLPLASADSTNVARNIGIDKAWKGTYTPPTKAARGVIIASRIEAAQSAEVWR